MAVVPRRRRWLVAVAAAVAAVVGVVLGVTLTGGGARAEPQRFTARPAAYQVTYRVDAPATGAHSREVLTVRRPFDASDVVYPAGPATAAPTSGTLFGVDGLFDMESDGAVHQVAGRQPGPAGSDQALAVELPDLLRRGLARDTGDRRTVAGRTCRVYRFVEPPAGPIRRLAGADHDDICLDDAGLLLAERWTYQGRVVRVRTAVRVRVGDAPAPVDTAGATPIPADARVPQVTADPSASTFLPAPKPPAGYRLVRVDRFTAPNLQGPTGLLAASVVWAFADGPDVVTVEAGQGGVGGTPWSPGDTVTRPLDLPGFPPGQTALRSDGPEVRLPLGGGRWVRVHGTVPLAALVAYARTLQPPAATG